MAEKTIKVASFWYTNHNGVSETALRGDKVDIPNHEDVERGERLDAFASKEDLAEGQPLALFIATRGAGVPGVVTLDPSEVEGRVSPAGSADPAIQSGMVAPTGGTVPRTAGRAAAPRDTSKK